MHQIDSGLKRDYNESGIVDTVIHAISPHSSLRSCVETLSDLSLSKLRQMLRVHYREKAASEVYQQLATACQESNVSPQQFLLRALDLHNKVNFASQESDCEFNYGPALIQKTFVKSFETGLRDDILASDLRPTLCYTGLTHEELVKQADEPGSQQAERSAKLASEHKKTAKVNACEGAREDKETRPKNTTSESNQALLAEIRQIKSEISDLNDQVNGRGNLTAPPGRRETPYRGHGNSYQPNRRYQRWGCQNCQQGGRGDECDHRFGCRYSGYLARECHRNKNQGSRQGI